ncbi:Aste57867_15361 [Aphanomyces stellatus]|uniref:Aste57867_15361 protein n=1 Tax=Aphanomyces stellatus TaxID=120398 RepID=A0A485L4U2_9STRA|nr:hypothetical protein As57867_015305 [Aphanomyces stellatus]VFT92169.1 Aste57867_15361 [Aphanomyces stellatus]
MTNSLLGTTIAFYDANPIDRIINRYSSDTAAIDTQLPYSVGGFAAMFFAVSGSLLASVAVIRWAGCSCPFCTSMCGTLRQFLDPFGAFDDAVLWDVVTKAGLHSLVSGLPEKLSSEVAEKGSNLGVGERQMLCLARALLVQSKIVVLDEATAMDHDTDVQLQQVIATEFATATVLTIAHRLHTAMHSDRIGLSCSIR